MALRPTKKQQELLGFIENFIAGHGFGPSYREIMRGMGYKSVSTVATHIDNLIARGHLRKRNRSARSLEVVTDAEVRQPSAVAHRQWLLAQVGERFVAAESKDRVSKEEFENLYVLVGALKILGFETESRQLIRRLDSIGRQRQ